MGRSVIERQDAAAAGYDRRWAEYTARSLALLRPFVPADPGRVLDVGCGTGALARALAEWGVAPRRYLGVDPSAGMLRRAAHGPGRAFVRASAGALPVRGGAFDLVVTASSLHDWPDAHAGLRELRRAAAPEGRLLLVDWSADFTSIRLMRRWLALTARPVARVHTRDQLADALRRAGFRVDELHARRISPLWGMMLAVASPA